MRVCLRSQYGQASLIARLIPGFPVRLRLRENDLCDLSPVLDYKGILRLEPVKDAAKLR